MEWFQQLINPRVLLDRLPARLIISWQTIMHTGFKSGIVKTDISDYFPIFFYYKYIAEKEDAKKEFIYKSRFSDQSIETFKIKTLQTVSACWPTFGLTCCLTCWRGLLYYIFSSKKQPTFLDFHSFACWLSRMSECDIKITSTSEDWLKISETFQSRWNFPSNRRKAYSDNTPSWYRIFQLQKHLFKNFISYSITWLWMYLHGYW